MRIRSGNVASRMLENVPEDKKFWVADGKVFQNLQELAEGLESIDKNTFLYHANREKNDFSSWIRLVIGDVKLANEILKNKTKDNAALKVRRRISWLKKKK